MFDANTLPRLREEVQEFLKFSHYASVRDIGIEPFSVHEMSRVCRAVLRCTDDEGLTVEHLEKLGFKGINDEHNVDVYTLKSEHFKVEVVLYWKSQEVDRTVLQLNGVICYDDPTEKELTAFVKLLGFILPEGL